jgi:two-component system LytT family response regulator
MSDIKIPTIIIEDEPAARLRLKKLLDSYNNKFEIIGEARDGQEGVELINKLRPELIFLDIEMPKLNGFEMLSALTIKPKIIFITAYNQYAVKAFEENAIDYLLKPIDKERLDLTIERLSIKNELSTQSLIKVLSQLTAEKESKVRQNFSVKIGDKFKLIRIHEVAFFIAEDKYVFLNCVDGKRYIISDTIKDLEQNLSANFLRIHKGCIINCDKILEVHKYFRNRFIVLLDDQAQTKITSGANYYDQINNLLQR